MKIGSLFSGAAGLDMAVEAVFGGDVVWHSEVDPAASKVLAYRYPDVPNLGDITKIDWTQVEPVDILCGGFPCTDVSAAGKRAGMHGTRSGLWSHYAQAIEQLRPRLVVIENVRGLLSAHAHRPMESDDVSVGNGGVNPVLRAAGAVLGDLADLGYDCRWTTVAASAVGAPHRRERVFIIATDTASQRDRGQTRHQVGGSQAVRPAGKVEGSNSGAVAHAGYGDDAERSWPSGRPVEQRTSVGELTRRGSGESVELLPTPAACNPNDGEGTETWLARRDVVKERVGNGNGMGMPLSIAVQLLPTPVVTDASDSARHTTTTGIAHPGTSLTDALRLLPTPGLSDVKTPRRGEQLQKVLTDGVHMLNLADAIESQHGRDSLLCTPSASDGAGGKTSRSGGRIDEPLLGGQAREMNTAWGKYEPAIRRWESLTRPAPAPTEPNKNGNPRLSAEFSSWLMGWPAGWVTDPAIGISRNDQLRIVGNGVVPQQAIAALTYLLAITTTEGVSA